MATFIIFALRQKWPYGSTLREGYNISGSQHKTQTTYSMLCRIKNIYSENYPSLPPLELQSFSSDFEAGIASAFKLHFPSAKPLLCQFHFQQRMKKTIQEISGKYKKIPPLVYIKNLTREIFLCRGLNTLS